MSPLEVAAGLIFHQGRLLITQRYPEAHLGGLWEFPGGKLKSGETFENCLRRELREELGVEVEVGEMLETITHTYPEKTILLKFFRCRLLKHQPRALGCHDLRWVMRHELDGFPFPGADARLLDTLKSSAGIWG